MEPARHLGRRLRRLPRFLQAPKRLLRVAAVRVRNLVVAGEPITFGREDEVLRLAVWVPTRLEPVGRVVPEVAGTSWSREGHVAAPPPLRLHGRSQWSPPRRGTACRET